MSREAPICFVTVCKGRLAHLRESLPHAAAQAPCVLVDYACPDGAGHWVEANHPEVVVLSIGRGDEFNLSAGRNAGAGAARTEWLFFLDADVVPDRNLVAAVSPLLKLGRFFRPLPVSADTWGALICRRADFESVGGFDEAFTGWGVEDDDLFLRLQVHGLDQRPFPAHLLHAIEHDDGLRTRFYASKNRELSRRVNFAYMALKHDLRGLTGREPDLATRRAMHGEVHRVLSESIPAGGDARLDVQLPDRSLLSDWSARRSLRYEIPAPRSLAAPAIGQTAMPSSPANPRPPMPFIVGTGRCGSTLLRLMLDSHPELAIPDETHFIPMLAQLARQGAPVAALANALRDDARWRALGMDPEALVQRALLHDAPPLEALLRAFYEAYAARSGKRRYGDKTPPYVHHMPLIRGVLSEARFVHLIRDGRDVAVSMREAWWGPDGLAETAAWWAQTILAARACAMGTEAYLEIRYEDLVTEPEQTLRRICRFLQLDWDPAMLAYSSTARARLAEMMGFTRPDGMHIPVERVRALHSRVAGPPDPSRIDAWRGNLSPEEAHQFDLLAGPLLAEFGYPSSA